MKSSFERTTIGNIRLHVLPSEQFKTYAVSVYIGTPLAESTVTPVALTPFVLRRGTASLPETKQFRERLDDLYGAGFGFDIYKRGDYQIVQFRMDIVEDRYVHQERSLLGQALSFIGEAITNPLLEDGAFSAKYVDAEKNTVQKKLEAIVNDKATYAAERCIQEMCKNEPYRLHPLGFIEALEDITPKSLYESYLQWLQSSPIDLYVVGNTTLSEVETIVRSQFRGVGGQAAGYMMNVKQPAVTSVNSIVEKLDVNQGKLNMGLRTNATYAGDDYAAALMYNGVLGGYPHSKLFINVREKESLAYYASSRLDGHKGILTIQSGIEIANYEKAVDIIRKQISAMEEGEISETEMTQTKAMIAGQLRQLQDSAYETISFDFNSVLSGRQRSVQGLIEDVEKIGTTDIRRIADQVKLDTIYFLRDLKGE
ncbi:EF-P 5-aminopentanol modification-associated protein YfmF [Paenibacillus sp. MBLB4367]|uniref:EF-P 5-aminopentanol modification-associated protein YfmF n=1 Tax=Paenibacillus sp. MBLB4367 TaxID=3384767 RepID=UPI00390843A5